METRSREIYWTQLKGKGRHPLSVQRIQVPSPLHNYFSFFYDSDRGHLASRLLQIVYRLSLQTLSPRAINGGPVDGSFGNRGLLCKHQFMGTNLSTRQPWVVLVPSLC